jgi:4-hydroxybenzoate polyprenyltransferase
MKSVNAPSLSQAYTGWSRLKLFLALSRTPHGLIDMTTPAFAALLWLGAFPPFSVMVLGVIAAFAGYTAVYALNDVIDYRADRAKALKGGFCDAGADLDAVMIRHPMACGFLSFREGLLWALAWAGLALTGAYLLNPLCVVIFLAGSLLEAVYCLLWRVTHLRTLVSGAVKTSGAVAAVFAVDPRPAPAFVVTLFLCLFFWEIGGQNVPNDWTDIEEDRRFKAKTIPVRFGTERSNGIILVSLGIAVGVSLILFSLSQTPFELPFVGFVLLVGGYLLLLPAYRLFRTPTRACAMALFNRASYYPMSLLLVVLLKLIITA